VCLGDYVGYGPDPEGAIEMSRKVFGERAIMGNYDAALLCERPADGFSCRARKSIDRQRIMIGEECRSWLSCRPPMMQEGPLLCLHGDARLQDGKRIAGFGYVFRNEDAGQVLSAVEDVSIRVVCVGHAHEPAIWRVRPGASAELFGTDHAEANALDRLVVNVGTVGCPRSTPCASYAVVDICEDGRVTVDLRRIGFDHSAYRDALVAAQVDVPVWLEDRLAGRAVV